MPDPEERPQLRASHDGSREPQLSVVVVVYDIPREAPRTLQSLSAGYQRDIAPGDYEVIVVDNGSDPALDPELVASYGSNFRLIRVAPASPSPAHAVNRGIAEARGGIVGVLIDGARIASPGLLHFALHGATLYDKAVVATLGWYLGFDFQRFAMRMGYDAAQEDALLASIKWPEDGYRLFEISTLDESSVEGWFCPIAESNALFLKRELWDTLQGMDERFDGPGGGLLNLDMFDRALGLPGAQLVILLGEGTFHQLHGGVATNSPAERLPETWQKWASQYARIRQRAYQVPAPGKPPAYIGTLSRPVLLHFTRAAVDPIQRRSEPPLGPAFDRNLWAMTPPKPAGDPVVAELINMAHREFYAGHYPAVLGLANLARSRAPDEPEPLRLLSLVASSLDYSHPIEGDYFVAMGDAFRIMQNSELAASNYRKALTFDRDLVKAHVGLATLRFPGDFYYEWLERFYTLLEPETVIEIGVFDGQSIARVRPPTLAIGVDPNPRLAYPLTAETHIFTETSDAFFARRGPDSLLAGRPVGVGFIDGLHLYEQALMDFINLERYCGPRSVILFHDTVPLDEATQKRACDTKFHTGDVWKVVPCLKHYRPDLDVFTIATPWTGLTVVTGLDPASRVLAENFDEAVARFIEAPFADIQDRLDSALNIVSNDWSVVEARLKARHII
ncbi:class I SAM-dependent methyltransferase [uncultured Bradyrhizobium sp.]|uniref:class I SAM-dependent methyltransferase n=1 Tax=uncultured Bradyrhizobium sp. TaxID=199684 RepID=UPI0035CAE3C0